MADRQTYVALLRGINVGKHHKVPMADLRQEIKKMGLENVRTLLNSGNVIMDGPPNQQVKLEEEMAAHIESVFEFAIPVLIRKAEHILELVNSNPFENIKVTNDIRLYITFLKEEPENSLALPWISEDESFQIIDIRKNTVCSILDLSVTKTPKGMDALEQLFGKNITTRNWNTINRIADKIDMR